MATIRASVVNKTQRFEAEYTAIRARYSELDSVIDDFRELLILDYQLPEVLVDPSNLSDLYATKLDYPPLGSNGRGKFLIIYKKPEAVPSMTEPYRTCELVSLIELGV